MLELEGLEQKITRLGEIINSLKIKYEKALNILSQVAFDIGELTHQMEKIKKVDENGSNRNDKDDTSTKSC